MKAVMFFVLTIAIPLLCAAEYDKDAFARLLRNGAVAKYVYRVVDDEGVSVSNATAHVWFRSYGRPHDEASWAVKTDTNGIFVAEHRLNEKFSVGIDKEGYYHTHDEINYFGMSAAKRLSIVKDGKWQPYGETRTVVLKRIRNPWAVKVFAGEQCHRKIPVFDQWLPFDMEKSDWLAPYGKGICNDVLLRFTKKLTDKWFVYSFSMEASFTNNPYAGCLIRPLDEFSDMKTAYIADTNAEYQVSYLYSKECAENKAVKITGLENGQYLVFRTRTRIDENGNLVGAHYGKLCREWNSNRKEMQLGEGCFNPIENDPNIEGDQSLLYKIKNCKKVK